MKEKNITSRRLLNIIIVSKGVKVNENLEGKCKYKPIEVDKLSVTVIQVRYKIPLNVPILI